MRITTDSIDIDMDVEEIRHFKINDKKELRKFIEEIRIAKPTAIGFEKKEKK
jgi:hypothetical protein